MRLIDFSVPLVLVVVMLSLVNSNPTIPDNVSYTEMIRAAIGFFSAVAFYMLQKQLHRLAHQPAWGTGWELARAGCLSFMAASILILLNPVLDCDFQTTMAAGGLFMSTGLCFVVADLHRLAGGVAR